MDDGVEDTDFDTPDHPLLDQMDRVGSCCREYIRRKQERSHDPKRCCVAIPTGRCCSRAMTRDTAKELLDEYYCENCEGSTPERRTHYLQNEPFLRSDQPEKIAELTIGARAIAGNRRQTGRIESMKERLAR